MASNLSLQSYPLLKPPPLSAILTHLPHTPYFQHSLWPFIKCKPILLMILVVFLIKLDKLLNLRTIVCSCLKIGDLWYLWEKRETSENTNCIGVLGSVERREGARDGRQWGFRGREWAGKEVLEVDIVQWDQGRW